MMILLANPNEVDDLVSANDDPFEDASQLEKMCRQRGRMPVAAQVSASRGAHRSHVSRRNRPERSAKQHSGLHRRRRANTVTSR